MTITIPVSQKRSAGIATPALIVVIAVAPVQGWLRSRGWPAWATSLVVVILVCAWLLYPPKKTINLGLDLQGGLHLVLGVDVDKALEAQVDRASDTIRADDLGLTP